MRPSVPSRIRRLGRKGRAVLASLITAATFALLGLVITDVYKRATNPEPISFRVETGPRLNDRDRAAVGRGQTPGRAVRRSRAANDRGEGTASANGSSPSRDTGATNDRSLQDGTSDRGQRKRPTKDEAATGQTEATQPPPSGRRRRATLGNYVFDRAPAELPPPPAPRPTSGTALDACADRDQWARALGGIDAGETTFRAYLEGRSERAVVIDDARVIVHERRAALTGAYVPCGAAATLPERSLDLKLDTHPPTVKYYSGARSRRSSPLLLTLPKGEVEAFRVSAHTERCFCKWTLEFSYVAEGKRRSLRLSDGGRPFQTSWVGQAEEVFWRDGRWQPATQLAASDR